ncbi:MAG: DMT family transporter [Nitrospinota bacterium]|nr:DMT family transporter [Nitrospinota bacterium]
MGLGELMAAGSAIIAAFAHISIRQGMRTASPLLAALIVNTVVSSGGLFICFFQGTFRELSLKTIFWFVAMGMTGPGFGRITRLIGINKVGLNASVTISAITPLWVTFIAVFILGENPTFWDILGTLSIVCGVIILSVKIDNPKRISNWFQKGVIFPILASIAYALAPVFAKLALNEQKIPMAALGIGFLVGNIFLLFSSPILKQKIYVKSRGDVNWLFLSGFFNFCSSCLLINAIMISPVSTAIPLSRTAPIWLLIFSYIFLRKLEKITKQIIMATILIVLGSVFITAL